MPLTFRPLQGLRLFFDLLTQVFAFASAPGYQIAFFESLKFQFQVYRIGFRIQQLFCREEQPVF